MLQLGRVTKVKVLFLVLVFVFNFDLFKFSAAILEKGLFGHFTLLFYRGRQRNVLRIITCTAVVLLIKSFVW